MKRLFLSTILVVLLTANIMIPALASNVQDNMREEPILLGDEMCITVSSEEELNDVLRMIEEHNMGVEELWELALREASLPENQNLQSIDSSVINPRAVRYATASTYDIIGILSMAEVVFELGYNRGTNAAGYYIFSSVASLDAYPRNNVNNLSSLQKSHVITDSGRTVAANFSYRISIYNSSNGTYVTSSVNHYVEFYASTGTGRVIDP